MLEKCYDIPDSEEATDVFGDCECKTFLKRKKKILVM